jgi:hypothetical protein
MDSNSITTMNHTKYLYTLSSFFGAPYFFQHCSSRKAFVSVYLIWHGIFNWYSDIAYFLLSIKNNICYYSLWHCSFYRYSAIPFVNFEWKETTVLSKEFLVVTRKICVGGFFDECKCGCLYKYLYINVEVVYLSLYSKEGVNVSSLVSTLLTSL